MNPQSKWLAPALIAFLIQAITAIVYIARLGSQVEQLTDTVQEIRVELREALPSRYTAAQALADRTALVGILDSATKRLDLAGALMAERLSLMERRIEKLEEKK